MSLENEYPVPALKNRDDELDTAEEDTFFLKDGRPVRFRILNDGESQYTAYYFSTINLEEYNQKKLTGYLDKNGIKVDSKYINKITVSKYKDCEDNMCWEFVIALQK